MAHLLAVVCLLIGGDITSAAQGPCDIFGAAGTPCVAAHSTVRALFASFGGALYQVKRASDNTTLDINALSNGGVANSAAQDTFCKGTDCVIQRIYDQSSYGNHLDIAPAGGYVHQADMAVNASRMPLTINGGSAVYAAYFEGGMGYRIDTTKGVARDNDPETIYMVTSGTHFNGGCCFDYGNAESDNNDDGKSTMEALYFGNSTGWGRGADNGPWVMADLENGLWAGNDSVNAANIPVHAEFVFAMLKGGEDGFALKAGDAQGPDYGSLKTMYDGPRPPGYQPMHKQGSIILGIGGDNSDSAIGTFFEGAMTAGYSSDTADADVYTNVIATAYGK